MTPSLTPILVPASLPYGSLLSACSGRCPAAGGGRAARPDVAASQGSGRRRRSGLPAKQPCFQKVSLGRHGIAGLGTKSSRPACSPPTSARSRLVSILRSAPTLSHRCLCRPCTQFSRMRPAGHTHTANRCCNCERTNTESGYACVHSTSCSHVSRRCASRLAARVEHDGCSPAIHNMPPTARPARTFTCHRAALAHARAVSCTTAPGTQ